MNMPRTERSKIQLDPDFQTFIDAQKPSTRHTYTMDIRYWIEFTGMNGKESLELKKKDTDAKTEKLVLSFQQHLLKLGKAPNTSRGACGCIRGFYASKRMPLVFIRTERKKLTETHVINEDYRFTKEDLAKMQEHGDLTEKYILLVGASVGLRAGDFLGFTFGDFRCLHLEEAAPICLGTRNTQKENVKATPFLSSDAVAVLKTILDKYPEAKNTDRILDYADEQCLTLSLKRMFNEAHLNAGNKVVRFHNLRKYLIDRLSAVASESQWKQIVGKHISEGAYVSTDQLREVYTRAMPSIVINGAKVNAKLEALEEAIADQQKQLSAKDTIIDTLQKRLDHVTTETTDNSTTISSLLKRLEKLEGAKNEKTDDKTE